MTQLSLKRSATCWIAVICAPTLLTAAGLWAGHIASLNPAEPNTAFLQFCLLSPGYVLAELLAAFFLSGGIHSAGELFWLGAPVSWIFYFAVGALIFCVRRKDDAT
jgi:hypothetical protein